jgi:hypothetical protein
MASQNITFIVRDLAVLDPQKASCLHIGRFSRGSGTTLRLFFGDAPPSPLTKMHLFLRKGFLSWEVLEAMLCLHIFVYVSSQFSSLRCFAGEIPQQVPVAEACRHLTRRH